MWGQNWREAIWSEIDRPWDVLIIGGGVTGAGILRLVSQTGCRALLVDANDFSFGTSSRSSKLVHGGFRYLWNHQFSVTHESVREREWLLREAAHLVTPLPFIMPNYARYHIHNRKMGVGVILYDLMAPKWDHHGMDREDILKAMPHLNPEGLLAGYEYIDAGIDDARLVIRLLGEAARCGGTALNYARAESLLRNKDGQVCGAIVRDTSRADGESKEVQARVVIQATGPWTDELRGQIGASPRLRKLRGSHLAFSKERFPLDKALTLFHPKDKRAMFAIPWEGVTLLGTTDIDHDARLEEGIGQPYATQDEIDYLIDAAHFLLPGLELGSGDILSTFAGLRPIVRGGADSPSKESRAHALWIEDGLVTITGGKLTTFRIMAKQVLATVQALLPDLPARNERRVFDTLPEVCDVHCLSQAQLLYQSGRHGAETLDVLASAQAGELENIEALPNLWAELRWAARQEGVVHLDDLLLRRVRLGLELPEGGLNHSDKIRAICQPELGWDDVRWNDEELRYRKIWQQAYSPCPGTGSLSSTSISSQAPFVRSSGVTLNKD